MSERRGASRCFKDWQNVYKAFHSAKLFCVPVTDMLVFYELASGSGPDFLYVLSWLDGCGVPPRLSFAELKNSDEPQDNFPIGTTVTYTCRPGYAKIPGMSLSVTCLDTQMWSAAPEICKSRFLSML